MLRQWILNRFLNSIFIFASSASGRGRAGNQSQFEQVQAAARNTLWLLSRLSNVASSYQHHNTDWALENAKLKSDFHGSLSLPVVISALTVWGREMRLGPTRTFHENMRKSTSELYFFYRKYKIPFIIRKCPDKVSYYFVGTAAWNETASKNSPW